MSKKSDPAKHGAKPQPELFCVPRYIFVTDDHEEAKHLNELCKTHGISVDFSSVIPIIRIAGLDAIYNSVTGYEASGGLLRDDTDKTRVYTTTEEMRGRNLPNFVVVGRTLAPGEAQDRHTASSVLRSVVEAVNDFNKEIPQIKTIALLLEQFLPNPRTYEETLAMMVAAFS